MGRLTLEVRIAQVYSLSGIVILICTLSLRGAILIVILECVSLGEIYSEECEDSTRNIWYPDSMQQKLSESSRNVLELFLERKYGSLLGYRKCV